MDENCIKFPNSMTPEERDEIERILNTLIDVYPDTYERNPEAIVYMGAGLHMAKKHEKDRDDEWAKVAVKYSRDKERTAYNKGMNIGIAIGIIAMLLERPLVAKIIKRIKE